VTDCNILDLLSVQDFNEVKNAIQDHVNFKLASSVPIDNYHLHVDARQHKYLSSKRERILPEAVTSSLLGLSSFQQLFSSYPNHIPATVVFDSTSRENRPELYFRLVRPHCLSDVGPAHCDYWFNDAMNTGYSRGSTIKFWFPIVVEPNMNGLYFYPNAPAEIPYNIIVHNGFRKPVLSIDKSAIGEPLLVCPNHCQAVVFSDEVLHSGAPNQGSRTRVSLELCLVKA